MSIAELAEDRVVEGLYAVARKQRLRTRSGSPYLALELVDPTGKIEARVWNDVELLDKRFGEGDAVRVLGRVERFRDRLQLEVRSLEPAETDPAELVPESRRDVEELDGFFEFLASEIAHPGLRELVSGFVGDGDFRARLRILPATQETTTPGPGACSNTRWAWPRSAARPHSSISGCGPTCCSLRRSSTTRGVPSSSTAGRSSYRPPKVGSLDTSISASA